MESSSPLLQDLLSGDAHRIWAASSAIAYLRDTETLDLLAAHLSEIQSKTKGIELGGALYPNRERLEFALRKLAFCKNRAGCLCKLYPDYLMYDPHAEAKAGNVRITDTAYLPGGSWVDFYACECTLCGTRFRVEEREYHYPWWGWKIERTGASV